MTQTPSSGPLALVTTPLMSASAACTPPAAPPDAESETNPAATSTATTDAPAKRLLMAILRVSGPAGAGIHGGAGRSFPNPSMRPPAPDVK